VNRGSRIATIVGRDSAPSGRTAPNREVTVHPGGTAADSRDPGQRHEELGTLAHAASEATGLDRAPGEPGADSRPDFHRSRPTVSHGNRNPHSNSHADLHSYPNSHANPHPLLHAHADPPAHPHPPSHLNSGTDSRSSPHRLTDPRPFPHSHSHSHPHTPAEPHPHPHPHPPLAPLASAGASPHGVDAATSAREPGDGWEAEWSAGSRPLAAGEHEHDGWIHSHDIDPTSGLVFLAVALSKDYVAPAGPALGELRTGPGSEWWPAPRAPAVAFPVDTPPPRAVIA
jgi:hypothetical protein